LAALHRRLPRIGGCPQGKNVLFEEALADKFFQVLPEASAVDGLVSRTVMVRTIFFRFGECEVVLDWLRVLSLRLVLDGVEDFIDGGLNGVNCCSILKACSEFNGEDR